MMLLLCYTCFYKVLLSLFIDWQNCLNFYILQQKCKFCLYEMMKDIEICLGNFVFSSFLATLLIITSDR